MDELRNEEHARELICRYFPLAARTLAERNIDDFARISYFLEQPEQVIAELKKLEEVLQQRFRDKVRTQSARVNDPRDPKAYIPPQFTKGLLTSYLNEWDAKFGFNALSNETADTFPLDFQREQITISTPQATSSPQAFEGIRLPTGKAPVITGFASPPLFRLALLRLGYHWKDPGAGEVHGDMTHRLQWFAITSAYQRIGVTVNPLYLFQKLGSPNTWNPEFRAQYSTSTQPRALWDFVCDCFVKGIQDDNTNAGPFSNRSSYRSPVTLQRDLTTPAVISEELPLLRRIINRKKLSIRDKYNTLESRNAVAVVDYVGPDKTSEMVGRVAFYIQKKGN